MTRRTWIGLASTALGLVVVLAYLNFATNVVSLPERLALMLAFAIGPVAIVGVLEIYRELAPGSPGPMLRVGTSFGKEGMIIRSAISKGAIKAASGLAVALLVGAPAAAETMTFVTPIAYGSHLPGLGRSAVMLAKTLKERSKGNIVLDLKEPGDGTAPHEILDKVSDGKVDAGFATASFWAAEVSASPLFSGFPFGPDASGYLAWFERGCELAKVVP